MKRQSIVWFFSMPIFVADNDVESLGNHGVDVRSRVDIVMSATLSACSFSASHLQNSGITDAVPRQVSLQ
jgi:hypothetical protein